jgi:hypothetical protein
VGSNNPRQDIPQKLLVSCSTKGCVGKVRVSKRNAKLGVRATCAGCCAGKPRTPADAEEKANG